MENRKLPFNFFNALRCDNAKALDNYCTETMIKSLIENEEGLVEDIEGYFQGTKDESKRIYLLADYIRYELVEIEEDYIDGAYNQHLKSELHTKHKETSQAFELLNCLIYSVDYYEVAKALISRYKKQKGISNRKNKKNLSLVKKSA